MVTLGFLGLLVLLFGALHVFLEVEKLLAERCLEVSAFVFVGTSGRKRDCYCPSTSSYLIFRLPSIVPCKRFM